jgi:hypothetical protein
MSAEAVRPAAWREFGGVSQTKDGYRDYNCLPWIETFSPRFALRLPIPAQGAWFSPPLQFSHWGWELARIAHLYRDQRSSDSALTISQNADCIVTLAETIGGSNGGILSGRPARRLLFRARQDAESHLP